MATISDMELEHILSSLEKKEDEDVKLEDIGSKVWCSRMSMMEELNVQAALQAASGGETVWRSLAERNVLGLAVEDMVALEVWREEVLGRMLKMVEKEGEENVGRKGVLQVYMILFSEANLCNLLETTLFNRDACSSISSQALDLTDYCVRHLTHLVSEDDESEDANQDAEQNLGKDKNRWHQEETVCEEIHRHERTTYFQISMKCLSILRYLTDHCCDYLPLGVTSRLTVTHDVPELIIRCLELKPWIKKRNGSGRDKVFQGSDWQTIDDPEELPKLEGQCWIALYNLLAKPDLRDKYQLNDHRKDTLLRLIPMLSKEHIRYQLPFADGLKKWLLELQLGSVPKTQPMLLMEPIAEIREGIMTKYRGGYDKIAEIHLTFLLLQSKNADKVSEVNNTESVLEAEIAKLVKTFESEQVQKLVKGVTPGSGCQDQQDGKGGRNSCCVVCRLPDAKNRCSRCHNERYCSRDCQVKHWPKHKIECGSNNNNKNKNSKYGQEKIQVIQPHLNSD